jgi:hypothetical protein
LADQSCEGFSPLQALVDIIGQVSCRLAPTFRRNNYFA